MGGKRKFVPQAQKGSKMKKKKEKEKKERKEKRRGGDLEVLGSNPLNVQFY